MITTAPARIGSIADRPRSSDSESVMDEAHDPGPLPPGSCGPGSGGSVGVPCGTATDQLATKLGVKLKPVSEETKVTDVLGKVMPAEGKDVGEADAGIVYVTDAKGAGDKVETVPIKGADQVVNNYPISVLASAPQPALAAEFMTLVTSQTGKDVLNAAGFITP